MSKVEAEILWEADEDRKAKTKMTDYSNWVGKRVDRDFSTYDDLHKWSTSNKGAFWQSLFEYFDIIYEGSLEPAFQGSVMPDVSWFPNVRLNYAENILEAGHSGTAIWSFTELDRPDEGGRLSYSELKSLVARCARALKAAGIGPGDRVAGYVANVPEAMIASLAVASIGATWSSASPDFGLEALCDRLGQVQPKLLFASSHYAYKGKFHHTEKVVSSIQERVPSIETIISIPYSHGKPNTNLGASWQDFLGADDAPDLEYYRASFSHPLYILFSSGTTGTPKCIVHGTGGVLLQHAKEHHLHADLQQGEKLFYFTTCGWMMWNWLLSGLLTGASIVLYDGSPAYPGLSKLWTLCRDAGVTHFGTSGKHIESSMKLLNPAQLESLDQLPATKSIMYTGSPLSSEGYRWIYKSVKSDVHLAGISGGTDIVSCFVLGNPNDPVRAGRVQVPGLGVRATAFDEDAKEIQDVAGELVCLEAMPSMPIKFYGDPNNERYKASYFDHYPGVWRHGDYVTFFTEGGIEILGRSDATLNPGGVRIGSAELYAALDSVSEVLGGLAVGWKDQGDADEVIVLFVQLKEGLQLDDELKSAIKSAIRKKCSPKHVPSHLFSISSIPITRSGKPVELSVKAILAGKEIKNKNALANPEVLDEIYLVKQKLETK